VYAGIPRGELPITEDVASREVTLPLFPTMTKEQIEMIRTAVVAFAQTPTQS
jgi:dTDP-4-amino-4,6-dideoxygalactose transaminase